MSVQCRFCDLQIQRSRVSAHYRKCHYDIPFFHSNRPNNDNRCEEQENLQELVSVSLFVPNDDESDDEPEIVEIVECIMCCEEHMTKIIPCNHESSCHECLLKWWKESFYQPRCPICRGTVEDIMINNVKNNSILYDWKLWRDIELEDSIYSYPIVWQHDLQEDNRVPSFY